MCGMLLPMNNTDKQKRPLVLVTLVFLVTLGMAAYFFLRHEKTHEPVGIISETEVLPVSATTLSLQENQSKEIPSKAIINNNVYDAGAFTISLPADWQLVKSVDSSFSNQFDSAHAIFKLGDQECYGIFGGEPLKTGTLSRASFSVDDYLFYSTGSMSEI